MMEKRDIPESIATLIGPKKPMKPQKRHLIWRVNLTEITAGGRSPLMSLEQSHGQLSHDRITLVECSRGR